MTRVDAVVAYRHWSGSRLPEDDMRFVRYSHTACQHEGFVVDGKVVDYETFALARASVRNLRHEPARDAGAAAHSGCRVIMQDSWGD